LRTVTASVHDETTRITQEQIKHLDKELHALDDIVARIQEQNNTAHNARTKSFADLASGVQSSYKDVEEKLSEALSRACNVKDDVNANLKTIERKWGEGEFQGQILGELNNLREHVEADKMDEYSPTGQTPAKTKDYTYRTSIPTTQDRTVLISRMQNGTKAQQEDDDILLALNGTDNGLCRSPSKGLVFADKPTSLNTTRPDSAGSNGATSVTNISLRELDLNTIHGYMAPPPPVDPLAKSTSSLAAGPLHVLPPLKRLNTTGSQERKGKSKRGGVRSTVAGKEALAERENLTMPNLSASVGAASLHPRVGRRLRSRDRT
jgi:kinesin family protein 11